MALKCRLFGSTKVYISGIVMNNKMSDSLLESNSTEIREVFRESSSGFIGTRNIQTVHLCKDGLCT